MSSFEQTRILAADSPSVDAFGRWRVSNVVSLFNSDHTVSPHAYIWQNLPLVGGATITHQPTQARMRLAAGTANADFAARQTYEYIRYQPGKSQAVFMTGVLGAEKANVRRRIGQFDANDGVFFEQLDEAAVTVRTSTGGSPSDAARFTRSNWNLDKMNGNGRSGVNLDLSAAQIFIIDYQWLGVGRVRFGFDVDGKLIYCHEVLNANSVLLPYMKRPHLPLRAEIENLAGVTATNLDLFCASVISEGGIEEEKPYHFSAKRDTAVAVTTRRAVLSLRPTATFPASNPQVTRGSIIPESVTLFSDASIDYEVVVGPTFSGTPTWTARDTEYSQAEYSVHGDAAAGALSGGLIAESGMLAITGVGVATDSEQTTIRTRVPLTLDYNGANPRAISIVVTSHTGTANVRAAINWKELY